MEPFDVSKFFAKKFTFSRNSLDAFKVDDIFKEVKWSDEVLDKLKCEINATKSLLNDKDACDWRKHTDFTNRAGYIIDTIKEFYDLKMLTQAWIKFYEILNTYHLINTTFFRSLHLCEAPGAFIDALGFYLGRQPERYKWQWVASTFNPYYEGHSISQAIFDDRFILPTYDHWNFGPDNTGDIMQPDYLSSIQEEVNSNGKFHLVTADGSIDCQNNPEEQEALVAWLHFTEVVLALHVLAPGGSLVIKKFTLLECDSICLTFLLTTAFDQVNAYKPSTSKAGNSEVYFICIGYKSDVVAPLLPQLSKHLGKSKGPEKALFSKKCIPKKFLKEIRECSALFLGFQKATILENIRLSEKPVETYMEQLEEEKQALTQAYFLHCHLKNPSSPSSSKKRKFCHTGTHRARMALHYSSYNARHHLETPDNKLGLIRDNFLEHFEIFLCPPKPPRWFFIPSFKGVQLQIPLIDWLLEGKPLSGVHSSKFCCPRLLFLWDEVLNTEVEVEDPGGDITDLMDTITKSGFKIHYGALMTLKGFEELQEEVLEKVKHPRVFAVLMPSLDECTEKFKQILVSRVCTLLKMSETNDNTFITLSFALTRFTVGLLFILAFSYKKVRIWVDPQGRFQTWQLTSFTGPQHPSQTMSLLEELQNTSSLQSILEVVPTPYLAKGYRDFYNMVTNANKQQYVNRLWRVLKPKQSGEENGSC